MIDRDENGCAPNCPIRILGEQSGVRKSGGGDKASKNTLGWFEQELQASSRPYEPSEGTAARYFAQFYPRDEPAQETETMSTQPSESPGETLPINQVLHGDCLEVLSTLPENSVDAIVTDPPYGMGVVKDIAGLLHAWLNDEDDSKHLGKSGFMGKEWDAGVPGPRYWREAYRVLKPGGHILAFSSTRTYDLLVIALRLAGFECRDQISWLYGSGFPKSLNVSAAIDKLLGKDRAVVGISPNSRFNNNKMYANGNGLRGHESYQGDPVTAPATPESAKFSGYGSALKPSHEPICLARKPLAEKSIAANVLHWGTGAINVDASRVGTNGETWPGNEANAHENYSADVYGKFGKQYAKPSNPQGRFPSNTLLSHTLLCQPRGEKRVRGTAPRGKPTNGTPKPRDPNVYGQFELYSSTDYADSEGMEVVAAYECSEDCPVFLLDQMSGVSKSAYPGNAELASTNATKSVKRRQGFLEGEGYYGTSYSDQGGASRYYQCFPPDDMPPFIYTSKASRAERSKGLDVPLVRLRSDLTPEQVAYVEQELAKIGGAF